LLTLRGWTKRERESGSRSLGHEEREKELGTDPSTDEDEELSFGIELNVGPLLCLALESRSSEKECKEKISSREDAPKKNATNFASAAASALMFLTSATCLSRASMSSGSDIKRRGSDEDQRRWTERTAGSRETRRTRVGEGVDLLQDPKSRVSSPRSLPVLVRDSGDSDRLLVSGDEG